MIVVLLLALAWLGATHEEYGRDVRLFAGLFAQGMSDELRGTPEAEALEETRRFEQDGIAFDYPAVLRLRLDDAGGGERSWHLEYGMFSVELMLSGTGIDGETYLDAMADLLAGGSSIDAQGPMRGRSAMLCGEQRIATRARVKLLGSWSAMEAFDLPAHAGLSRTLVFDDEEVRGGESRLARATYAHVLGSLRCTASDAGAVDGEEGQVAPTGGDSPAA